MPPAYRRVRIDESVRGGGAESQAVIMRKNATAANATIVEKGAAGRSEIAYIVPSAFIANNRLPGRKIAVCDFDRIAVGAAYRRLAAFEQRQASVWRAMLEREQARGLRSPQHPRTTRPLSRMGNGSVISFPFSENQRITAALRRRWIVRTIRGRPAFVELRPLRELFLKVVLAMLFADWIKLVTDRPRRRRGRHHENRFTQFRCLIRCETEAGGQRRLRRFGLPDRHTRQADGSETAL
ncbi:MAG TPA: hypothetical protein VMV13_02335 [Candidatus Binataceae bacterium]|nr:hypothetical protein [Candidatus Binataceae bacterium]